MIRVIRMTLSDSKYRTFSAVIQFDGTLYCSKICRSRKRVYLADHPSIEGALGAIRAAMEEFQG